MKHKNLKRKISYFLFAVAIMITAVFGIKIFNAEEDNTPSHNKGLKSKNDGTYQLSLDVTGSSQSEVGKANVIVILDISGSMNENAGNETRMQAAKNAVKSVSKSLLDNNASNPNCVQLALVTFSTTADTIVDPTTKYSDVETAVNKVNAYGGTNWEAALNEVNNIDFGDDDPKYVIFVSDGDPTFRVSSHRGDRLYNNGTVRQRNIVNPDEYYYTATDWYGRTSTQWWDDKTDNAGEGHHGTGSTDYYGWNYSDAAAVARTIVGNNVTLYSIGAYGNVEKMEDLAKYAYNNDEEGSKHYYNASSTSALQDALNAILEEIQTSGVGEVSITDGTTTSVKASSGTVHLLKIDEESYKYWLSMEVEEVEGQANTYKNSTTGKTITFTKSGNNYVGKWTDRKGEHSITGEIIEDEEDANKKIFKMEWTDEGNDLHPEAPTPAHLVTDEDGNDSVDWDLSSHGILLNGVTYTVTFDAWPTQYTYDLIADLENETVKYEDLSSSESNTSPYAGLDKYISKTLTGDYFLKTNTKAVLNYKDTRKEDPKEEHSEYINPPAQELKADEIDVIKKWENYYDSESGNPIDIILNRTIGESSEEFYRTTLNFQNNFTKEDISISTGLMRLKKNSDGKTGKVQVLESGHDYSFEEASEHYYKWELVAQTVHPMLINGELKELVLLDDAATQAYTNNELPTYSIPEDMPSDTDYYDDGTNKYVKLNGKLYIITDAKPTIKAYNYRRSNLNLTKTVDGENADPDELFEFKITVKDPGLSSGEKLWFSIFDENNDVIIDENLPVSDGWTPEIKNGNRTGFYYGENESTLTVSLKEGQNLRFTNLTTKATYTIVESDKDNFAFTDAEGKAKYGKNHGKVDYVKGTDYKVNKDSKTITGDITLTNSTFSIEVKNTYELATIDLTKVWDDSSNQDGKRPDEIKVQIKRQIGKNGTPENYGEPVTITKDSADKDDPNKWVYTIENTEELALPRFDTNGNEYLYSVEELTVPEYETTYSPTTVNQTEGKATYTITNKHTPEKYNGNGELEVTKHWDDFDNEDGLRKTVTIELHKNGNPTGKTITLTTAQDSKAKFTDLPMYEDGEVISYTIVETTELDGYEKPDYDMNTAGSFKVTNKHTPLYNKDGELEVTKIWDDVQDIDDLRKDVTIELYINGDPSGKTITLTTDDGSKAKFTNLPKYDKEGNVISYTIVETTELDGYEKPEYDMNTAGSFKVTNKHMPQYNKDGKLKVTKYWEDNNNYDGLRDNVTIELYINGQPSGKKVNLTTVDGSNDLFTDLPKYDKNGDLINYTIVETTELDGYEDPKYDMNTPGDFKVTNIHGVVPVSINVKKIWIDNDDQDGKRKDEITVKIFANGEFLKNETIKGDVEEDTWYYTIRGLDRYKNGSEITYTIEEVQVDEYEEPVVSGNAEDGFTIKNTHNPSKISKTGTKTWDHGDNKFKHPDSITVILHAKVGDEELDTTTQTVTEKNGKWEYSFTNLDEYKDGKIITYWVDEAPVTDYKTVIDKDGNITNTYSPEKFTINGTKTWDDEDDQDGKRPDHITVILHGKVNDQEIKEVKQEKDVYETNGKWEYSFEDVLKYAGGEEIEYYIEELPVNEYDEPIIHGTADEGFSITNHHTPETITYIVKKNWDDYNNADEIRPDSINVTLYKTVNGVRSEKQRFTISEANDWTYTFTDLPRYEGGKEITYDIVEDVVEGYATSYEINNDTVDDKIQINTTITNTQTMDITINKTWDDQDNHDGIRPEYIIVNIFANGDLIDSIRISKDDNWKKVVEGLLKYENGVLITYTIEEKTVDGYKTTIDGFNIINTHEVIPNEPIEVMPPKTGIDKGKTNYSLLIVLTLVSIYEVIFSKVKANIEVLNNLKSIRN